jgi:hypothetical protein
MVMLPRYSVGHKKPTASNSEFRIFYENKRIIEEDYDAEAIKRMNLL